MRMSTSNAEMMHLEEIAQRSRYSEGLHLYSTAYVYQILKRFMKGGKVLEVGPAEGELTKYIINDCEQLTVVDGAKLFCDRLRALYPQANVIHSLIEDYHTSDKYDVVILRNILEHVNSPAQVVSHIKGWLNSQVFVFAVVPNARSLHRQAAVLMGLLPSEDALNEMDQYHGHRRVFSPESFRAVFIQNGYRIKVFGG